MAIRPQLVTTLDELPDLEVVLRGDNGWVALAEIATELGWPQGRAQRERDDVVGMLVTSPPSTVLRACQVWIEGAYEDDHGSALSVRAVVALWPTPLDAFREPLLFLRLGI